MKTMSLLFLLYCGWCWGQPGDCRPSALNIPGAPYPCVHPDRRVTFRVAAPDAQKVQVRLGGAHEMARGADGLWMATLPAQVVGFHYYSIVIDGAVVADPATRFSEALTNARIKNVYFESPGTAHEWLTWRRCFYDFAPRLFR